MVQYTAFRRSLRISTLALCSAAIFAIATPASARPHHGAGRHAHRHYIHHGHAHRGRHHLRVSQQDLRGSPESAATSFVNNSSSFGSDIVAEARRYIGGNPTSRSSLWCARFMNMVLQRSGHQGTGSDMARSFSSYGHRVSGPQVGAIAVMSRGRRGGHVGVVSGIDPSGNPIIVSGNHGHRVAESVYPKGRIYAYVVPTS
jgi:uncharacterized protein (TIGR02594 family)